jgi:hypothetical protein
MVEMSSLASACSFVGAPIATATCPDADIDAPNGRNPRSFASIFSAKGIKAFMRASHSCLAAIDFPASAAGAIVEMARIAPTAAPTISITAHSPHWQARE